MTYNTWSIGPVTTTLSWGTPILIAFCTLVVLSSQIVAFFSVKNERTQQINGNGIFCFQSRLLSLFSIIVSNAPLISNSNALKTSFGSQNLFMSWASINAILIAKRLTIAPQCRGLMSRCNQAGGPGCARCMCWISFVRDFLCYIYWEAGHIKKRDFLSLSWLSFAAEVRWRAKIWVLLFFISWSFFSLCLYILVP